MASKSQPDKRQNRQRILFSFNVDLESPLGIVFQYLMRNPKLPSQMGKQKGVEAMAAFWRPFAFQMKGDSSDEELKMLARESLVALSRQMELIAETFEVDLPQSSQAESLSPELERAIAKTMDSLFQKYVGSGGLVRQSSPEPGPTVGVTSTNPLLEPPEDRGIDFEEDVFAEVMAEDEFLD
jgi:hypothetical protein